MTTGGRAHFDNPVEEIQFDDPWPEVRVPLSATAEKIAGCYCATLTRRIEAMQRSSDDPLGELRPSAPTPKNRKRASNSLFAGASNGEATAFVYEALQASLPAAAYFRSRGATTLADLDRLLNIDADTVHLVESVMRAGRPMPDPQTVPDDHLTFEERELWNAQYAMALEAFDGCIERAGPRIWKQKRFGAAEMLGEAINAGRRKWTTEVLTCEFRLATPADAGWYCRLIGAAAEGWHGCHDPEDALLRGYHPDDVIRLAWPLLKAGPFFTDCPLAADARREWKSLGKGGREKWAGRFNEFLTDRRLRSWDAFIERINSTVPQPPQPSEVEWAGFTERVIAKLTPIGSRMGREIDWNRELSTSWRLVEFLHTMAGALFEFDRWPPRTKRHAPTIVCHDDRSFSIGASPPVTVTVPESEVLRAFIGHGTFSMPELRKRTRVEYAERTLGNLRKKYGSRFAVAITMPGGPGRGGYSAAVRDARQRRDN